MAVSAPIVSAEAGAPGTEFEITPEMIEAAAEALMDYDPESERLSEAAARILRAAFSVSPGLR